VVVVDHYYWATSLPMYLSTLWTVSLINTLSLLWYATVLSSCQVTGVRGCWGEIVGLVLHYVVFLGGPLCLLPPLRAISFWLAAQFICGLLLSIVFIQSHNGMAVYSKPPDFYSAQIISTRNISSGLWNDWFSGQPQNH
jgi:hypothetical protein